MKTKINNLNREREKLEIIKWLTTLKDNTALERIKMLKETSSKDDWWNEISDEEKSAIEKGLEDIRTGRVKAHKEVRKLYEKWL